MPLRKFPCHQALKFPEALQANRGWVLLRLLSIMQDNETQQECVQLMA
jgi:hypothetical protein